MAANDFISKLKADGTDKDQNNLKHAYEEYKKILGELPQKDKGIYSLNVLCILCRNIDKVPSWTENVCKKALVALAVDCVRETQGLEKADQVKTLACIYHIHKHIVKNNTTVPPEQVLKLSDLPFDSKILIKEYCKTYWNILVDRLLFIESLKTKVSIAKLLPKLTDDITRLMTVYEPLQFVQTALVFTVKKLFYIFNGKDLNDAFKKIFETLSQCDIKQFKALKDKEAMELYVKFNECIYTVSDYSSRHKFNDCILYLIARTCISLLGHKPDIFHCVQNFYLNGFCSVLIDKSDQNTVEAVFSGLLLSCENTEKLGYGSVMRLTYPFVSQLLRLYIEYTVTENQWKIFTVVTQVNLLKLVKVLMMKLATAEQLLKCENCNIRTGLHDALRLSFVLKHFVGEPLKCRLDLAATQQFYIDVLMEQYKVLNELKIKGCSNYEKCLKKSQTDIHNTAILLNKSSLYEYSVKLFNIFLRNEIENSVSGQDLNISRGFYNKAICELDKKDFENSIKSAYLSYLFAYPDSLTTDKHMSLVIDIKAKTLKYKANLDLSTDELDKEQLMSSLDVCEIVCKDLQYGDMKRFFCKLNFSAILKYEFKMYSKLWASLVPIAGVWTSLYKITQGHEWLKGQNKEIALWILIEVVLKTASVVRSMNNGYYKDALKKTLVKIEKTKNKTVDLKLAYATLLLLNCEYDLAEASETYGWKISSPNMDPDQANITRTIPTEHKALSSAFRAVEVWTEIMPEVKRENHTKYLPDVLPIMQVYVPLLLHHGHPGPGLQLAHCCLEAALLIDDRESYVRNASSILSYASKSTDTLRTIIETASKFVQDLLSCEDTLETAVVFLCEASMFAWHSSPASASRLLQLAQHHVVVAAEKHPDKPFDLAIGGILSAQAMIGAGGTSILSSVTAAQRHYITSSNPESKWTARQRISNTIKLHSSNHSIMSANTARALQLWRRARSAAGAGLPSGTAMKQAKLLAAVCCAHRSAQAQAIIDNRLKHILGLQPSNETQPSNHLRAKTTEMYLTPKPTNLETMLEAQMFKKMDKSPTSSYTEKPKFRIPDFLYHESCNCYACYMPDTALLACRIAGLEASTYYRSNDFDTARVFFDGVLKIFSLADGKILETIKRFGNFEKYILDMVEGSLKKELVIIKVEILIEASFFELSCGNYLKCDENIIQIQELLTEIPKDLYLYNELYNLLCASAKVRKSIKKPLDIGLEDEMSQLKLTPVKVENSKTPERKMNVPPKVPKPVIVKPEEMPSKNRKVIKLNLDDDEKVASVKKRTTRSTKIPEPKVAKPAIEAMTPKPRSTRVKPKIMITKET